MSGYCLECRNHPCVCKERGEKGDKFTNHRHCFGNKEIKGEKEMKLTYTPGPWEYFKTEMAETKLDICIKAKSIIAWCYSGKETSEYDARLVACAPDFIDHEIREYKKMLIWVAEMESLSSQYADEMFDFLNEKMKLIESATGMSIDEVLK